MGLWEPPPLEMFRANPARNGHYPTRAVHRPAGLKWKFKTRGSVISSPAVVSGSLALVCFGSWDGNFYALDILTGAEKWRFRTGGGIVSSPAVDSVAVFFGSYDGFLYAVRIDTGKQIWNFRTMNAVGSSPLVTRQFFPAGLMSSFPMVRTLYVSFGSNDGSLYVLDADGRLQSRFETEEPIVGSPSGPVGASAFSLFPESPAPALIAAGSRDGSLYAIDMKTGKEAWTYQTAGPVDSSAAVANGAFYFGGSDRFLHVVDASTGRGLLKIEARGPVRTSPAVFEDTVFFGSADGCVYAADARLGRVKWKFGTRGPVESSPSVADGVVYFGSDDGNLYAVDIKSGQEKWRFPTLGPVRSSPVVADGVVYFGSNDGHLYAVG